MRVSKWIIQGKSSRLLNMIDDELFTLPYSLSLKSGFIFYV